MRFRRRYGAWIASLVVLSSCAGLAHETSQASPAMIEPSAPPTDPALAFEAFAAYREPPSLSQIERILGAPASVMPRPDRHLEVTFPGSIRFLRLVPAPPDGRARLDTGTMAALTFSAPSTRKDCLLVENLSDRLVASGWTSMPRFVAERHAQDAAVSRNPRVFSRHDRHLQLQLFAARNGCLSGYALLWNMDLSLLAQLMPGGPLSQDQ